MLNGYILKLGLDLKKLAHSLCYSTLPWSLHKLQGLVKLHVLRWKQSLAQDVNKRARLVVLL